MHAPDRRSTHTPTPIRKDRANAGMDRRGFLKALGAGAAMIGAATLGAPLAGCAGLRLGGGKDFSAARGIIPPMVTPFTEDGEIDWPAYERLIEWHIAKGVDGLFVVCGSGEFTRLTEDEGVQMARTAVRVARGRIKILCGSTVHEAHSDIERNITMTRRVGDTGVDGCFVTPPLRVPDDYQPVMQERVLEYLTRIHDETDHPLFIYEFPGVPFGFRFAPDTLGALSQLPRYVGMKDVSTWENRPLPGALDPVRAKLAAVDGRLKLLQANNTYLLAGLQVGCTGGVNTMANVAPSLFARMYSLWREGKVDEAQLVQDRITEILRALDGERYVTSAKLALSMMGVPIQPVTRRRRHSNRPRRGPSPEQVENVRQIVALIERSEREFGIA